MFVTQKTFESAISIFHSVVGELKTKIELLELNNEAALYELYFERFIDTYNVFKEGELYKSFPTLSHLKNWFNGYKDGIDDITVTICDECIDNQCIDPIQDNKSLSSKKRKND